MSVTSSRTASIRLTSTDSEETTISAMTNTSVSSTGYHNSSMSDTFNDSDVPLSPRSPKSPTRSINSPCSTRSPRGSRTCSPSPCARWAITKDRNMCSKNKFTVVLLVHKTLVKLQSRIFRAYIPIFNNELLVPFILYF